MADELESLKKVACLEMMITASTELNTLKKKLKRKYQESSIDGSDQKRGTRAIQIISQRHIVIIQ